MNGGIAVHFNHKANQNNYTQDEQISIHFIILFYKSTFKHRYFAQFNEIIIFSPDKFVKSNQHVSACMHVTVSFRQTLIMKKKKNAKLI
jgi:hypothetical protein